MIFEFTDEDGVNEVEVDDGCISTSYIELELIEEEDEDKTERQETE